MLCWLKKRLVILGAYKLNKIFLIDLDVPGHGLRTQSCLSADEIKKARLFVSGKCRHRFINGRLWLRRLISEVAGCHTSSLELVDRKGMAPSIRIDGNNVNFGWSFSRSGHLGAVAVTDQSSDTGVDIELKRSVPDVNKIAELFFEKIEWQTRTNMTETERSEKFLELWTAKEAIAKAGGVGLTMPFANSDKVKNGQKIVLHKLGGNDEWVGHVALREGSCRPVLMDRRHLTEDYWNVA